jgi:hypothetical protein
MKLIFDKNLELYDIIRLLSDFLQDKADDYRLLKNDMTVTVLLENVVGLDDPDNERVFHFNNEDLTKYDEEKKEQAAFKLSEEWISYTIDSRKSMKDHIETDKNYLATANEKNRSLQNIERRKKTLQRHERELVIEEERMAFISRFIDLVNEGNVKYEFVKLNDKWAQIMIFELEDTYIFCTHAYVWGDGKLIKLLDGDSIASVLENVF